QKIDGFLVRPDAFVRLTHLDMNLSEELPKIGIVRLLFREATCFRERLLHVRLAKVCHRARIARLRARIGYWVAGQNGVRLGKIACEFRLDQVKLMHYFWSVLDILVRRTFDKLLERIDTLAPARMIAEKRRIRIQQFHLRFFAGELTEDLQHSASGLVRR